MIYIIIGLVLIAFIITIIDFILTINNVLKKRKIYKELSKVIKENVRLLDLLIGKEKEKKSI